MSIKKGSKDYKKLNKIAQHNKESRFANVALISGSNRIAVNNDLLKIIFDGFELDVYGIHGIYHWNRVLENGIAIQRKIFEKSDSTHYEFPGRSMVIDRVFVELFSYFHDSMRKNELEDVGHGKRSARFFMDCYMKGLLPERFFIGNDGLIKAKAIAFAIESHENGYTLNTSTVHGFIINVFPSYVWSIYACWDSDRLDLARVGIAPSSHRLSLAVSQDDDFINEAMDRTIADVQRGLGI